MVLHAHTDYPIAELGDIPNVEAPVRECEVLTWNRDKYVDVRVDGVLANIKRGYVYSQPGRLGEVPQVSESALSTLPRSLAEYAYDRIQ